MTMTSSGGGDWASTLSSVAPREASPSRTGMTHVTRAEAVSTGAIVSRRIAPVRVLYATQRFWPYIGGMETIGERLVTGLRGDGFEVAVLTGREDPRLAPLDAYAGVP